MTTAPTAAAAAPVAERRSPAPVMLDAPRAQEGAGWQSKTHVSNLDQLDLAAVILRGGRFALIDVPTGHTVVDATFGGNLYLRIRDEPRQLVISHHNGDEYRLLTFDIEPDRLRLHVDMALPKRYGHQDFTNEMHLSDDGRYAYLGERERLDRPECRQPSYDGPSCLTYSVRIVDLDGPQRFDSVHVGNHCILTITPLGDGGVMGYCLGNKLVARDGSGRSSEFDGSGTVGMAPEAGWPDTVAGEYATIIEDGTPRYLLGDGSIRSAPDIIVADALLPRGYQNFGAYRIDGHRVLMEAGKRVAGGSTATLILVVDLASGRIEHSLNAPAGTVHISVLDRERGVVLVRNGETYAYQVLNLGGGPLSAPVQLQSDVRDAITVVR